MVSAMNRQRVWADLALLGLAAGWGGTFVMVKEATQRLPVFTFLAWRFAVGAIVLGSVTFRNRSDRWRLDRRAAVISIIAGLCFAAGYGFQTIGLQTIGPGRTGFVAGLTVVIVPIGAAILWRRPPNISAFIGIAFAVLGLALLTGGLSGEPPTAGDAWVLLGALWFAGQVLAISTLPRRSDPRALAAVQVVTMAIACASIAAFTEQPIWPTDWRVWGAVLFTGLIVTALGVTVQTWAQAYTSPTHTALIFATEPVFAALTGFLAIGERLSVAQLIGGALILSGMLISELGPVWSARRHRALPL
jgi:drug/metabolite transporter (DMT)-like permease